jgi:Fe-S oxidoreductase/coenzyme F420-reducing hydrogenase delta subunit
VPEFEPKILAFACNWCSYAGADLAGVSRYQYPPNISIIRVMCSGRVEPHFILKALRDGADGVLVTGCHIGDCHYISGNEKAQIRIENIKHILDTLGIESARVGLEWISASEGQKFAQTVTDFVERIRELGPNPFVIKKHDSDKGSEPKSQEEGKIKTGLEFCIECNKCASSCPITRVDFNYSPTVNVFSKSVLPLESKTVLPRVWDCLTCGTCSQRCPSGVRYEELIKNEREKAQAIKENGRCAHGEALKFITEFQTHNNLKQNRLNWISNGLKTSSKGDILYFVGCLPYFKFALFHDAPPESGLLKIGDETLNIARSTIALLNRAGIIPAVLPNERCCGHDSLWTGDEDKFKKLAKININNIKKSGAEKVVVACAEGFRTLKLDYPKYFGKMDFEVLHTTELFSILLEEGKLSPTRAQPITCMFQDPCRLGRHAKVLDAPRKVLKSIPELNLLEFDMFGRDSICCGGPNGWVNCGQLTRQIQSQKLDEMMSKEVDTLITACPKCFIHFKCAINSRLPPALSETKYQFSDINVLLDQATSGGEQQ